MATFAFPEFPIRNRDTERLHRFFRALGKKHNASPETMHEAMWRGIMHLLQQRIPAVDQWDSRIVCLGLAVEPKSYSVTMAVRTHGKYQLGEFNCPLHGTLTDTWEEVGEIPEPPIAFVMYAPPDAPVTDIDFGPPIGGKLNTPLIPIKSD